MRYATIITVLAIVLVAGLAVGWAAGTTDPASVWRAAGSEATPSPEPTSPARLVESSKNVFRVYGPDVYRTAIAVSQLVYPGPFTEAHPDAQPGIVLLLPSGAGGDPFYAEALAAAALVHHPRNGPILFTDPERLHPDTAAEIERLAPTGGDTWPQVLVVGRVAPAVADELADRGLRVERLAGADPFETAALIDERVGRPDHVLVVRGDDPAHGLPGVAWIAHMDDASVLLVESDRLPEATRRALEERQAPFAAHILGPEGYISAEVERQLRETGAQVVTRIGGEDPYETAVAFARFREGAFGWGIAGPGHGFYFVTPENWQAAVAGALTAHLGGHGPLLFTDTRELARATRQYLEEVRPTFAEGDPTLARFNRGYLVAPPEEIGLDQQAEIDWWLESVPEMDGEMPGPPHGSGGRH